MTTTVNISLPKNMYDDAKRTLTTRRYSTLSELIRDALRDFLYTRVTKNGFTPEFEEEVIKASEEPISDDVILKTPKDVENYFRYLKPTLKRKKEYGKDTAGR